MANPKVKGSASSALARRLRDAGPVPDVVYGGRPPHSERKESQAELLEKLKLGTAVGKLRKRIGDIGIPIPERLSELSGEEALKFSDAVDRIRIGDEKFTDEEIKRAFWESLEESESKSVETERLEIERAKRREAMMALSEMETTARDFRQNIAEGSISCEEFPYAFWLRVSEIFQAPARESFGYPNYEAELKAQLVEKQEEILRLREALPQGDPEIDALEAEVAKMVGEGRGPESYSDRSDPQERPLEFLQRVYGRYLRKGREALYLPELRKLDARFVNALTLACRRAGLDIGDYVPKKSARTDKTLKALGIEKATMATRALTALRMRKTKD